MKIQAVCYFHPDGYPPIVNSARLLAAAGHQVDILCRDTAGVPKVDYPVTVTIRRLGANSPNNLQAYLSFVLQTLRLGGAKASVFVGHDMHGFLVARLLAALYRKPLVYHCHDFVESRAGTPWGGRFVKTFERCFARTSDLVIVPDSERAKLITEALRLPRPPLIVANSPLQRASRSMQLRETLASYGFQFPSVLFRQGRIGPGHALEATVRSMPLWHGRDWGFVIMGLGDESYIQHLCHTAHEYKVVRNVAFLPHVSYDQVASFTAGASVGHALYAPININFLYATTASNKILEYMAAGLPLLVSDRPGLRALVDRYECGLTADESDPVSIANAVNTLLDNPEACRRMGENGVQAFDREFRYDKQFAPVKFAIERLAGIRTA